MVLAVTFWSSRPLLVFVPAIVAMLFVVHFQLADMLVLGSARARLVAREDDPALHAVVERLALLAGIRPPRVAVSSMSMANALAAGVTPRRATVVVAGELRERLTRPELEAVVAHEIAHVANRDAIVLTAASFFRTLAGVLDLRRMLEGSNDADPLGIQDFAVRIGYWLLSPLRWLLLAFGGVLTLALSRYREYAADRGAAQLTGAPEQLMSALQKLDVSGRTIPRADLRRLATANAFLIVSVRTRALELLSDHPPLEKRLARLAVMARELERPLGP